MILHGLFVCVYSFTRFSLLTVEIATLTRKDGKSVIRILDDSEVDVHIKNYEAEEARLEAEKKKEADKKKAAGGSLYVSDWLCAEYKQCLLPNSQQNWAIVHTTSVYNIKPN